MGLNDVTKDTRIEIAYWEKDQIRDKQQNTFWMQNWNFMNEIVCYILDKLEVMFKQ